MALLPATCSTSSALKFSLGLNHLGEVVYVMDLEPATLGLLDMIVIVMVRQDMGYKTSKKVGKPYHKGRTARVERYIQTIRRRSSALMTSVADNIHELLDDLHCLRGFAHGLLCILYFSSTDFMNTQQSGQQPLRPCLATSTRVRSFPSVNSRSDYDNL